MEDSKFTQLCVWPSTVIGPAEADAFVAFMLEQFGVRVKYETDVITLPDLDGQGDPIPDTGGRNDAFFFVHSDDVTKFAIPKMQIGARWWEDVISYNDSSKHLYSKEFIAKYPVTW